MNQRIHFAVLMLKSSFNFLGTIINRNVCNGEALHEIGEVLDLRKGSNGTFKDGLAEYYRVCPNKCVLKSFKFFSNNQRCK